MRSDSRVRKLPRPTKACLTSLDVNRFTSYFPVSIKKLGSTPGHLITALLDLKDRKGESVKPPKSAEEIGFSRFLAFESGIALFK